MGNSVSNIQLDLKGGYIKDTIVISAAVHGNVIINADGTIDEFVIPEQITEFYKVNAVSPGVCNIIDPENRSIDAVYKAEKKPVSSTKQTFTTNINTNIRTILRENNLREPLSTISEKIAIELKSMYSQRIREKEEEKLSEYTEFYTEFEKGFKSINCLKGGKRNMINKNYKIGYTENSYAEDWSIRCLNFTYGNSPDLFETVFRYFNPGVKISRTETDLTITTEQLVNFLMYQGITKIIFVDLTCNVFYITNPDGSLNYDYENIYTEDPNKKPIITEAIQKMNNIPYGGGNKIRKRKNKKSKSKSKKNVKSRKLYSF